MTAISMENMGFKYKTGWDLDFEQDTFRLDNINLKIQQGEFVTITGRNGSGKTTLAKLMCGLLMPDKGAIYINGMDSKDAQNKCSIRSFTGMVFQNPETQIIGATVMEDIAFGPANLGVKHNEIKQRVETGMKLVEINHLGMASPDVLSGGQKQKLAIAGILATKPGCIIMDEATSMLDPLSRENIMALLKNINRNENITVICITNDIEEACMAERLIVIDRGRLEVDSVPREFFADMDKVKRLGTGTNKITELFYQLYKEGISVPLNILNVDDAADFLYRNLYL
jgi:energy-coupling factor transport system ATP-binding protein